MPGIATLREWPLPGWLQHVDATQGARLEKKLLGVRSLELQQVAAASAKIRVSQWPLGHSSSPAEGFAPRVRSESLWSLFAGELTGVREIQKHWHKGLLEAT